MLTVKVSHREMVAFLDSDGREWRERERLTRVARLGGHGYEGGTSPAQDAIFRGIECGRPGWPLLTSDLGY